MVCARLLSRGPESGQLDVMDGQRLCARPDTRGGYAVHRAHGTRIKSKWKRRFQRTGVPVPKNQRWDIGGGEILPEAFFEARPAMITDFFKRADALFLFPDYQNSEYPPRNSSNTHRGDAATAHPLELLELGGECVVWDLFRRPLVVYSNQEQRIP